ncbi:hydroxyectoine utilization dehydratase EutB [Virgibacillus ihumii]|uniref:hydroxyectoine utilization dehydratase EutB n=1 Tax=Virgibacillus ihumii TaxID=2686091 RepID=UPI00157BDBA1|nr:hydroxyectoine utilization dehydratase EutB [Virgibacillus ihumii]
MAGKELSLKDIWLAKKRISPYVPKSPLVYSSGLSDVSGASVYLKLENMNPSGSFKIRGAANKILSLTEKERDRGITTFSTGNFGLSVAYMAKKLGIKAVICISERVPNGKVEALQKSGATVEIYGESQDDAEARSYELEREEGLTVIHPFDDPHIIAGQGTIGLELFEELPEVNTVLAGLSGGGLHSGLGVALKETNPRIWLVGLSTANGPAMHASIQAGKPIQIDENDTLADSLLGGIGLQNQYTFQLVQKYVDELLLMDEQEFADGMTFMLDQHKMIIEGAAASGIGALLHQKVKPGSQVAVIVTGSSVDTSVVQKLMKESKKM